jgi:hypothetical protein
MFDPDPNLPDDTLIEMVRLSPLIRKSLQTAGLKQKWPQTTKKKRGRVGRGLKRNELAHPVQADTPNTVI